MAATLLIVENDSFARVTLTSTLISAGFTVVASCDTAAEALRSELSAVQVAILDLDLGKGPTGLDLAQALRRQDTKLGIVFLTSFDDPRMVASPGQGVPAGSQYLIKSKINSIESIGQAIERALRERKHLDLKDLGSSTFGKLTQRQVDALRLIADGLSNAEISRRLNITEKSVEQLVSRLAARLNIQRDDSLNTRVSIARAYFRQTGATGV